MAFFAAAQLVSLTTPEGGDNRIMVAAATAATSWGRVWVGGWVVGGGVRGTHDRSGGRQHTTTLKRKIFNPRNTRFVDGIARGEE